MHPRLMPTWSCALSSFMLLGVSIGMALHVRLGLGRWPTPMIDKYTTAGFAAHQLALAGVGMFTLYVAIPLGLALTCFRRFRGPLAMHLWQAVVYGLGWLGILLVAWIDPFRFVTWFLD